MARMTASDMVDEIRDALGGETSETLSDARILRFINRIYTQISARYDFPELDTTASITTSSGTSGYELDTNILKVYSVEDTTNKIQIYESINRYQHGQFVQGDAASATGVPTYWYFSGVGSSSRRKMEFYPTPAGTYSITVYGKAKPTDLVVSPTATSPVLPDVWDDSLIAHSISLGARHLGDMDKSYKWKGAARDNDRSALEVSLMVSTVPVRPGSAISRATRGI